MSNREQYVHYNNVDSKRQPITHGVPQGSILGPKLFNLYINDVPQVLKKSKCLLYADDTSIYCSGNELQRLMTTVQDELKVLNKWFDNNKLSMNLTKTKYIIFGTKKIKNQINLKINDTLIEHVQATKFLGITVDEKLCWKQHINIIKSKLAKNVVILRKMKSIMNQNSLMLLYNALVFPYLS